MLRTVKHSLLYRDSTMSKFLLSNTVLPVTEIKQSNRGKVPTHRPDAPRGFFSVPRKWFHTILDAWATDYASVYKLLFTLVLSANIIAMATILPGKSAHSALLPCANAAIANLTAAIFIRQPYTVNFIFHSFWRIPRSTPLWLRHQAAKVYEYGGIHSGASCASLIWFSLFAGYLARDAEHSSLAVLTLVYVLLWVLICIVVFALPQMRRRFHNLFEQWHRFGGWFAIAVFWVAFVLFVRDEVKRSESGSLGSRLVRLPIFWLLLYLSITAIWPYLLLRKVRVVRTEALSDRAIRVYFDPRERIPPQHGAGISKSPLTEWHGFAAINDFDNTEGGSSNMIIAKAGDWTADAIENPPPYYYMKGMHMAGVGSMAKIFHRVVYMCTGSGAGPLLAALTLLDDVSLRIIWSAPDPQRVFGDKICNTLARWDPKAIIWDTKANGRPDLIELATQVYRESDAEALFFISNRSLTRSVVGELRRRGMAAYAPVFDS